MSQKQGGKRGQRSRNRLIPIKIYVTREIVEALDMIVKKFNIRSRSALARSIFALFLFSNKKPGYEFEIRAYPLPSLAKSPLFKEGRVGYGEHHGEVLKQLKEAIPRFMERLKKR